jgi:type IV pilus assembly protein PilQ
MKAVYVLALIFLLAFTGYSQPPAKPADTLAGVKKAAPVARPGPAAAVKAAKPQKPGAPAAKDTAKTLPDSIRLKNAANKAMLDTISPQSTLNKPEFIPVSDTIKIPVLDFKLTDIRDILRAIGMQYNVNIYLEPEVTGQLSLYLTNIPVKQAIDFVVKRGNYSYMVDKGIVKVFKSVQAPPPVQKPTALFSLKDGLLDIDVKAMNAKDVAKLFVDSAGINVVPDAKADREITAHVKAMKPEKALKVVFESNGFDVTLSDGVYYVSLQNWGGGGQESKQGASPQDMRRLSITVNKAGKVSIEVNNASLDQLVRSIVMQSGINIIIYENISGTVTAKFDSVALDDVLRFLLQNTKYTFWKDKNIYFLGSREMSEQKTTLVIPLKHIMANEDFINKVLPANISKEAVIKFDKEHNSLIVIGSFDIVAQAQEFIEKIDKFVPQVLIEALVVDFNLNRIRDYGLSLFTQGLKDTSSNWMSEHFLPDIDLKPGRNRTQRILDDISRSIGVHQIVSLPENFRAAIHALESSATVKVHSTPQIATINGNPASITIGETRYYKLKKETQAPVNNNTAVIGTDERFEVIKFNTQLEVTPWVMDDGYVMVKIRPEFNIPRTSIDNTTPPNVDTRVIESMVRLRNGQTIVLGGQRQTENVESRKGIPILGSIPILGWLFSSRTITKNETQMMIFLTPHVYYKDDNVVSPDDYFGDEVNKMIKPNPDKKNKKSKKTVEDTISPLSPKGGK